MRLIATAAKGTTRWFLRPSASVTEVVAFAFIYGAFVRDEVTVGQYFGYIAAWTIFGAFVQPTLLRWLGER